MDCPSKRPRQQVSGKVDDWSRKEEKEKDAAIAYIEASITWHQAAIEDLKGEQQKCREEKTKAIEDAQQELDRWVQTQEKTIAEAQ